MIFNWLIAIKINHDPFLPCMAKIPESMLEKIADLIIGEGYPSLPSRQRQQLILFFNSVRLKFSDLESSRIKTIIRDLRILNIDSQHKHIPSENLTTIIEYLAHPSHFNEAEYHQLDMIKELYDLLNPLYLELAWKDDRKNVVLVDTSSDKPLCYDEGIKTIRKIVVEKEELNLSTNGLKYDIFISYASEDGDIAEEIYEMIQKKNPQLEIFMAKKSIKAGDVWDETIRKALISSPVIVLLLTPKSYRKPWVLLEVGGAWFQRKKIIPLYQYVEITDLPQPIKANQGILITTTANRREAVKTILSNFDTNE